MGNMHSFGWRYNIAFDMKTKNQTNNTSTIIEQKPKTMDQLRSDRELVKENKPR